jgi:transcriptional regulator with XRE-family HTH domain
VGTAKDLPRDIGGFIRDLRRNARISLRQLADQAGVSNPYLSQIERGLRKPSAEVLQQLASALRVSTPLMYLRAGLLDAKEGQGVLAAIAADADLTVAQKQSLTQIYQTFRRENERENGRGGAAPAGPTDDVDAADGVDGGAGGAVSAPTVARTPRQATTTRKTTATASTPAKKAVRGTARKAAPAAKKEKS